jgi:two-component system chemotaxis sensor kinase CheA
MEDLHQIERKEKTPAQVVARLSRFIDSEKSKPGTDKTGDHSKRQYPAYLQSLVCLLLNPAKGILSEDQCGEIERNLMSLDDSFHDAPRKKLLEEVTTDFYIYQKSVGLDPLLREALFNKLALFPEESLPCIPEQDLPSEETSQPGPSKTMRVSEASVDQFLSYVGELVVVEEMYASLELQMLEGKLSIRDITAALRKTTEIFKGLSRQLQRSIMEIRKVPISNLFQRMPKIVHDVAKEKNKDIEIKIENGHLLVDKNLVEKMEAPLMHMVRNAADHGIEPPAVRVSQGKPELGTIVLTAEEVGETIRVTIVDDGAGLNLEKIRERALELGILDPQATLSEQRIIDVMFHSGVSTADEVSDISGRGVGMDVVKKNIDEAGGSIRTSTTAGKGTTFTLTLPSSVTTQIIQGFIVRAGSKRCIIPLDTVNSSLSYSSANISSVKGRQQVLNHNNHLIPVSRLRNLIDPDFSHGETQNDNTGIIVVTQAGGMEKAYVVDAVEGIRQVVVKPIHKVGGCEARVMSGGAVMGDGTVALILDMEKIMRFED